MAPRNVLFLMTDQHRVDTLGCYGNPLVDTPALDALAAEGTRFDRFYTRTRSAPRPAPRSPPDSTPSATAC